MEDDDKWVILDDVSEEETLVRCWRNLPFEIPYRDFRYAVINARREHERGPVIRTLLFLSKTAWSWSSVLFSTFQYRNIAIMLLKSVWGL